MCVFDDCYNGIALAKTCLNGMFHHLHGLQYQNGHISWFQPPPAKCGLLVKRRSVFADTYLTRRPIRTYSTGARTTGFQRMRISRSITNMRMWRAPAQGTTWVHNITSDHPRCGGITWFLLYNHWISVVFKAGLPLLRDNGWQTLSSPRQPSYPTSSLLSVFRARIGPLVMDKTSCFGVG